MALTITAQEPCRIDTACRLSNPALRVYQPEASLSCLTLYVNSAPSATARIPQLGTGGRNFGAEATSFQQVGENGCVWGNAAYTNGRKYNVVWNETSDFLLLYPYILGDPVGGDMKFEQYGLSGGYSQRCKRASYGLELGYRALSEYRDHDPRPNNTVADLHARVAFSWRFSTFQIAAVSVDAGKYKQTNELGYMNELGAQKEYHLTGIGNDFARFSGASNNTFYKGYVLGGTMDWLTNRLRASIGYHHTYLEKILSDLNRLPLNELRTETWNGQLAWKSEQFSLRANGYHTKRKGKDNLFGDATSNVYPRIGSREQYEGYERELQIAGDYRFMFARKWSIAIEPVISYTSSHNQHNDSGNQLNTDDMAYRINLYGKYKTKEKGQREKGEHSDWIHGEISFMQRINIDHQLRLMSVSTESLSETLSHIDRYHADGETRLCATLGYDHHLADTKRIGIAACWQHATYLRGKHCNEYQLRLTFTL